MKVNEVKTLRGNVKIEIAGFYYHNKKNQNKNLKDKYYWVCALNRTHNCPAGVTTVRYDDNHYVKNISRCHNHNKDEYYYNTKGRGKQQSDVDKEQNALVTSGSEEQPSTSGAVVNPQRLRYTSTGNQAQLNRLVKYLNQNPELVNGTCSKALKKKKFKAYTIELNALGPPQRKWTEWFKPWVDWKKKFRTKSVCPPENPERHLTESAVLSDEESELSDSDSGCDDDEEEVFVIESDEETENIFKEPLVENDAVRNKPMSPRCADFEDYNEEYPTMKCEPSSPGIIKQEFSEVETVEVIERDEDEVKLERYDSSDSLEGHVEEFLNMKRQLLAVKDSHQKIIQDQNLVEKEFHGKILNFMGKIKSSCENIEGYMKMNLEKNDALIEMKKETLEAYKQANEDVISHKQAKLKLQSELLESKRRKLVDLMVKKES